MTPVKTDESSPITPPSDNKPKIYIAWALIILLGIGAAAVAAKIYAAIVTWL